MLLEHVVLGSDVNSALYAFLNDCYYIPLSVRGPLFCEKADIKLFGSPRRDHIWSRLNLILSLQGRLLNYSELNFVKIKEKELKISESNTIHKYDFNMCYIFNTDKLKLDFSPYKAIPPIYYVYDDFELSNMGGKHKYIAPSKTTNTLAKELHFYCSQRVDGADYVTDCISKSVLTEKQIHDINYSDSIVKILIERHLESTGILGSKAGIYKSGKIKYRKPKVKHVKRVVYKENRDLYADTKNIKFLNLSVPEVLNGFTSSGS